MAADGKVIDLVNGVDRREIVDLTAWVNGRGLPIVTVATEVAKVSPVATYAIVVCDAALILVVPDVEPLAFKSLRPNRLSEFQADDRDSMVHFSRAIVGRSKHPARVKSPTVIASGNSDSHRTGLQLSKRACRRVAFTPFISERDSFSIIMLAGCVTARVRVVRIAHHAVVSRPLPAVPHPATVAPIVVDRAFEALLL